VDATYSNSVSRWLNAESSSATSAIAPPYACRPQAGMKSPEPVLGTAQQQRLDRLVGQRAQVVALPVVPQSVAPDHVVGQLQVEVRHLDDALGGGPAQRLQRREQPPPSSGSPTQT
jgi:hypothetical protein